MTKQYGNSKKYQQPRKAKMSGEKVAMSRVPSTLKVGWDILKSTKKSAKIQNIRILEVKEIDLKGNFLLFP